MALVKNNIEANVDRVKLQPVDYDPRDRTMMALDKSTRQLFKTMAKLQGYGNMKQYLADLVQQDVYANAYKLGANAEVFDYVMGLAEGVVKMLDEDSEEINKARLKNAQKALKTRLKVQERVAKEMEKAKLDVNIKVRKEMGLGKVKLKQLQDEKYRDGLTIKQYREANGN